MPERYAIYDLTRLSKLDRKDPAARRAGWDELQLVASLQGLANRDAPQLYLFWINHGRTDRFWLNKMREPGGWLAEATEEPIGGLDELLARFRGLYEGLVVWDEHTPATSLLAATVAGIENLLPVRFDESPGSLYSKLSKGLPTVRRIEANSKAEAYGWLIENHLRAGKGNPLKFGYYPDAFWLGGRVDVPLERTLVSNHDYFIANQGFFFDLSPWDNDPPWDEPDQPLGEDFRTMKALLQAAYDRTGGEEMIQIAGFVPWDHKYTDASGGRHGGVPSEWRFVEIASCYNAYVDADAPGLNGMANASFYQHFPLSARYEQPNLPTVETLRQRGYVGPDGKPVAKTFVSVYVGDYDAAAWLYQVMPRIWEDPARGEIPLGWAFNPNLAERFPVGMDYVRRTATPSDFFMAGDNGAGYLNPGLLTEPRTWSGLPSGLAVWERRCREQYAKWGLTMTGFVIDGYAPEMNQEAMEAYARFSPAGFITQYTSTVIPPKGLVNGVPFLRMTRDIDQPPTLAAQQIAESAPPAPGFAYYRNVLWMPSEEKALFEEVKRLRPDIEIVDPYSLMLLLKLSLEAGQ